MRNGAEQGDVARECSGGRGRVIGVACLHHLGAGYVDSFGGSDSATGTLTSPEFQISKKAINFLIGGGNHPGQTCINLLIGDKVVRTASGDGTGSLKWNGWEVSELKGQKAKIQIVDSYTGTDFGHLMVDHILFADSVKDDHTEQALWADYGSDFYAARSWRDIDGVANRTVWCGWMGNWDYANAVPNLWGRGFPSLPREVSLATFPEGVRLVQNPVPELHKLRREPVQELSHFKPSRNTYEIEAQFAVTKPDAKFGFDLLVGDGRKLVLSYAAAKAQLSLDRTQTSDFKSDETFNKTFPRTMAAPLLARDGRIKLHLFVDQSSIEVLADSGQVVLSALTFPGENQTGIDLFGTGGELKSFTGWELNSIWNPNVKPIPGVIEAQEFNSRSQGIGHNDGDAQNQGGAVRPKGDVDIEKSSEGGLHIARMAPGEWLAYAIQADYSRDYDFTARIAGQGGKFHLELDGKNVSGPLQAPVTGDLQKWSSVSTRFPISFGGHELRFCVDSGNFSLDKMALSTAGSAIVSGATYRLTAHHSGRVLDSSGKDDGAPVQQWQALGGDNQKWKIEDAGEGYYKITSQSSGKVLDVNGDKDGALALQLPWQDNDNQKWRIRDIGGGYYTLLHKNGGKALEVADFSKSNGGKVQQWQPWGGASQQWKLERQSGGAP